MEPDMPHFGFIHTCQAGTPNSYFSGQCPQMSFDVENMDPLTQRACFNDGQTSKGSTKKQKFERPLRFPLNDITAKFDNKVHSGPRDRSSEFSNLLIYCHGCLHALSGR